VVTRLAIDVIQQLHAAIEALGGQSGHCSYLQKVLLQLESADDKYSDGLLDGETLKSVIRNAAEQTGDKEEGLWLLEQLNSLQWNERTDTQVVEGSHFDD
jgi:hypothetical protein